MLDPSLRLRDVIEAAADRLGLSEAVLELGALGFH